ncbi:hypothetical protein KCU83_g7664, partial [Aureobasidium melanogenum]
MKVFAHNGIQGRPCRISKVALVGILFPVVIYICVAAILLFFLGCALYVCVVNLRQYFRKAYRRLKLLYWPEQTFDFLGLPPEIRIMVYRYTLPANSIYYLTARKMRTYNRRLQEKTKNEIVHPPPSLLRVCHLVYQELWPMIYKTCTFYITIYSIRDVLYTLHLIDKLGIHTTFRPTDLFSCMRNIRIRVNNLLFNIHPLWHNGREAMIAELSLTTQLWSGPGTSLLQDMFQAALLVGLYQGREIVLNHMDVQCLEEFLSFLLQTRVLDKRVLIKMLPWYQRRQSRHKSFTSRV